MERPPMETISHILLINIYNEAHRLTRDKELITEPIKILDVYESLYMVLIHCFVVKHMIA